MSSMPTKVRIQFSMKLRPTNLKSAHPDPRMNPATTVLDDLLPLLQVRRPELYENVAVLEVADLPQLLELAANPKIRRYLLARLSDTVALIDPGYVDALAKTLLAEGHTPKLVRGLAS
jgi:hypothetical protein